tara:strand:+ start:3356 stop:3895 length:540 start_codon:yes stop_codon:yes gene_type:complete
MKIAISGKMGSGKTYLADEISKRFDFKRASFAGKLKSLAKELFNMDYKNRSLLIDFATKMRDIDKNVWIRAMFKSIENCENVVIDDLRLENEYNTLMLEGWFICKINIDENERINRLISKYGKKSKEHFEHSNSITENDVVNMEDNRFNFVINGCSDYEELYTIIRDRLNSQNYKKTEN